MLKLHSKDAQSANLPTVHAGRAGRAGRACVRGY